MLEEKVEQLIEEQRETNRLLGTLIGLLDSPKAETKTVSEPSPVEHKDEVTDLVEEEPQAESKPENTLKDIVELCSSGQVTRPMILNLLDEYGAKKLPELNADQVPGFYARLVSMISEKEAA